MPLSPVLEGDHSGLEPKMWVTLLKLSPHSDLSFLLYGRLLPMCRQLARESFYLPHHLSRAVHCHLTPTQITNCWCSRQSRLLALPRPRTRSRLFVLAKSD